MKISLNQINELLEKPLSAKEVEEAFSLHAFEVDDIEEVEGDTVFDIDVLPNRSSDSLSVLGLARELSAILNIPLKEDYLEQDLPDFESDRQLEVVIEESSSATLYGAALIEGVEVKESPDWLKDFLIKQGQRPINNLVDATNYVLFFLGQPTHVFDADKLQGKNIGVRLARQGESITTLDNEAYELDESISVIFDASSEDKKALAIAGIKGGLDSAVSDATKRVILESARFDPVLTRKAAQKLKIFTDASKRFENDVPDLLPFYGMKLLIETVLQVAGGELMCSAFISAKEPRENPKMFLDAGKINKRLGLELEMQEMQEILKRLRFKVVRDIVQAPFYRTDIERLEDISEEVARLYGLSKIKAKALPESDSEKRILDSFYYAEKLRANFTDKGWVEVINSSVQDKGELKLANALASDKNFYRDDLSYQLKKALDKNERNAPLLGIYDALRIFEIGNVYKGGKEFTAVAFAARPIKKKKREAATLEILQKVKSEIESNFGISLPEPEGETLEFPLETLFKEEPKDGYIKLETLPNVQYEPFSQYPFVLRDIAVWLPESADKSELESLIQKHSGELLKRMDLFDEFAKDGRVSYAYHLVFQSKDRTLTDEEINEIMANIEKEAKDKGWEPR